MNTIDVFVNVFLLGMKKPAGKARMGAYCSTIGLFQAGDYIRLPYPYYFLSNDSLRTLIHSLRHAKRRWNVG
jgi:hypothetical protein